MVWEIAPRRLGKLSLPNGHQEGPGQLSKNHSLRPLHRSMSGRYEKRLTAKAIMLINFWLWTKQKEMAWNRHENPSAHLLSTYIFSGWKSVFAQAKNLHFAHHHMIRDTVWAQGWSLSALPLAWPLPQGSNARWELENTPWNDCRWVISN